VHVGSLLYIHTYIYIYIYICSPHPVVRTTCRPHREASQYFIHRKYGLSTVTIPRRRRRTLDSVQSRLPATKLMSGVISSHRGTQRRGAATHLDTCRGVGYDAQRRIVDEQRGAVDAVVLGRRRSLNLLKTTLAGRHRRRSGGATYTLSHRLASVMSSTSTARTPGEANDVQTRIAGKKMDA